MISKFCGLERDVDGADLALVHRELARDGELLAVLVENLEPPQADEVGLEIDAGIEAAIRGADLRHRERAVPDLDESRAGADRARIRSRARPPAACRRRSVTGS